MKPKSWSVFILLCILCFATFSLQGAGQEKLDDDQLSSALNQLSSPSRRLRGKAKDTLIRLGSVSIQPLIDLLSDIRTNPHPRYELGKEREGAEFTAQYNTLPVAQQDYDKYLQVDISRRIRDDAIELLGRLKAQEAIPTLIEMLDERMALSPKDITYPESRALIEIGAMAVPALIEALETAETKANERAASIMCSRLAFVLGEIGDERGLPILEEVQKRGRLLYGTEYIDDAIEKIKTRSSAIPKRD